MCTNPKGRRLRVFYVYFQEGRDGFEYIPKFLSSFMSTCPSVNHLVAKADNKIS